MYTNTLFNAETSQYLNNDKRNIFNNSNFNSSTQSNIYKSLDSDSTIVMKDFPIIKISPCKQNAYSSNSGQSQDKNNRNKSNIRNSNYSSTVKTNKQQIIDKLYSKNSKSKIIFECSFDKLNLSLNNSKIQDLASGQSFSKYHTSKNIIKNKLLLDNNASSNLNDKSNKMTTTNSIFNFFDKNFDNFYKSSKNNFSSNSLKNYVCKTNINANCQKNNLNSINNLDFNNNISNRTNFSNPFNKSFNKETLLCNDVSPIQKYVSNDMIPNNKEKNNEESIYSFENNKSSNECSVLSEKDSEIIRDNKLVLIRKNEGINEDIEDIDISDLDTISLKNSTSELVKLNFNTQKNLSNSYVRKISHNTTSLSIGKDNTRKVYFKKISIKNKDQEGDDKSRNRRSNITIISGNSKRSNSSFNVNTYNKTKKSDQLIIQSYSSNDFGVRKTRNNFRINSGSSKKLNFNNSNKKAFGSDSSYQSSNKTFKTPNFHIGNSNTKLSLFSDNKLNSQKGKLEIKKNKSSENNIFLSNNLIKLTNSKNTLNFNINELLKTNNLVLENAKFDKIDDSKNTKITNNLIKEYTKINNKLKNESQKANLTSITNTEKPAENCNVNVIENNTITLNTYMNIVSSKEISSINNSKNIIVICDDSNILLDSLEKLLLSIPEIKENYSLLRINDGIDIVSCIIHDQLFNKIKVVISDENMEFINGSKAIKILKEAECEGKINSNYFYISLTSFDDNDINQHLLNCGFNVILNKPLSKSKLLQCFKNLKLLN